MDTQTQRKHWEGLYRKPIGEEDYRNICDNLKNFFNLLHEWDKSEKKLNENEQNNHK
jgi:chemotaxis regulatin CheY-phosphate phosphatase CheZ